MQKDAVWSLGFWIMSAIAVVAIPTMANCMINNDRIRASEDLRIESASVLRDKELSDTLNRQYQDIVQRLTRIETKIEK